MVFRRGQINLGDCQRRIFPERGARTVEKALHLPLNYSVPSSKRWLSVAAPLRPSTRRRAFEDFPAATRRRRTIDADDRRNNSRLTANFLQDYYFLVCRICRALCTYLLRVCGSRFLLTCRRTMDSVWNFSSS